MLPENWKSLIRNSGDLLAFLQGDVDNEVTIEDIQTVFKSFFSVSSYAYSNILILRQDLPMDAKLLDFVNLEDLKALKNNGRTITIDMSINAFRNGLVHNSFKAFLDTIDLSGFKQETQEKSDTALEVEKCIYSAIKAGNPLCKVNQKAYPGLYNLCNSAARKYVENNSTKISERHTEIIGPKSSCYKANLLLAKSFPKNQEDKIFAYENLYRLSESEVIKSYNIFKSKKEIYDTIFSYSSSLEKLYKDTNNLEKLYHHLLIVTDFLVMFHGDSEAITEQEKVRGYIEKAMQLFPNKPEGYVYAGIMCSDGSHRKTKEYLLKAIELGSRDPDCYSSISEVYIFENQYENALKNLKIAKGLNPDPLQKDCIYDELCNLYKVYPFDATDFKDYFPESFQQCVQFTPFAHSYASVEHKVKLLTSLFDALDTPPTITTTLNCRFVALYALASGNVSLPKWIESLGEKADSLKCVLRNHDNKDHNPLSFLWTENKDALKNPEVQTFLKSDTKLMQIVMKSLDPETHTKYVHSADVVIPLSAFGWDVEELTKQPVEIDVD